MREVVGRDVQPIRSVSQCDSPRGDSASRGESTSQSFGRGRESNERKRQRRRVIGRSEDEVSASGSTVSLGSSAPTAVGVLPNIQAALLSRKRKKLVGSKE